MLKFVQTIIARRQPVLGVCFGHQLLGRGLGGEVRQHPAGWEVGTCKVKLTDAGLESPLFAGFDPEFDVIESHRDAVFTLPAGARLLATNAHTPIQAFSVEDRFFGVQFHPEMNGEILRHVWTERRVKLRGQVGFDLDQALDSANADAPRLFHNFIAALP
jgi:GMP synthase (glutamine-hydrolysing)